MVIAPSIAASAARSCDCGNAVNPAAFLANQKYIQKFYRSCSGLVDGDP
jgi:hypothetical protein